MTKYIDRDGTIHILKRLQDSFPWLWCESDFNVLIEHYDLAPYEGPKSATCLGCLGKQ